LIGTALEENYDLREAVARVSAARANLGITRADQFPTVTATTNITNLRSSSSGSIPLPPAVNPDRTFGSVFLNLLSFEVDVWGRLRRTTEAARANFLATEQNRKAVVTTLVSDTATAYFTLLELDTELEIANRTLSTAGITPADPCARTGRHRDRTRCAPGGAVGLQRLADNS